MKREQKMIEDVLASEHDNNTTLPKFIAYLTEELHKIDPQYRDQTRVRVDSYDGGGTVKLEYVRPETDEEMASRLTRERRYADEREAKERRELAALKAKYE